MEPEDYMRRALDLAEKGEGCVSPNPLVGAVVVKNGAIVGEGFHAAWGKAHAETCALEQAGEEARDAELYVTLEPCNHEGATGKCTDTIISSSIRRVVIGMSDPNPDVEGEGAEFLRSKGIDVETGVLEQEALFQNRFYVKNVTKKVPYVIIKWAMSLDGYTATRTGDSKWISSDGSRHAAHALRNEVDAVLVGVNTVCIDNPLLTCRGIPEGRDPVRIVIDPELRTPPEARLFSSKAPLIFVTGKKASQEKCRNFREKGAECMEISGEGGRIDLNKMLSSLREKGITSILVEGGGTTAGLFVDRRLADEVMVFCAPCLIGGQGVNPVMGSGIECMDERIQITVARITCYESDICMQGQIVYE